MSINLQDFLLIQDSSIFKVYIEILEVTKFFILPFFIISLVLEYFGEMNFTENIKKLFLVILFINSFYFVHSNSVKISFKAANEIIKKVNPNNFFFKNFYAKKIRTKNKDTWSFIERVTIPSVNDLIISIFYVLSKVFVWLLKLIYSSVYHLTYIFSGVTALLYFFGWTSSSIKGTFQSMLWCCLFPFVLVSILALVGNSVSERAERGQLAIENLETLVWYFGITLLLTMCPLITHSIIKGDGVSSSGSKLGTMITNSASQLTAIPVVVGKLKLNFKSGLFQAKRHLNRIKGNL